MPASGTHERQRKCAACGRARGGRRGAGPAGRFRHPRSRWVRGVRGGIGERGARCSRRAPGRDGGRHRCGDARASEQFPDLAKQVRETRPGVAVLLVSGRKRPRPSEIFRRKWSSFQSPIGRARSSRASVQLPRKRSKALALSVMVSGSTVPPLPVRTSPPAGIGDDHRNVVLTNQSAPRGGRRSGSKTGEPCLSFKWNAEVWPRQSAQTGLVARLAFGNPSFVTRDWPPPAGAAL